jgi:hypothetical protein
VTYLLDISVLLAWLWEKHEHHRRVLNWEVGKSIAICKTTDTYFANLAAAHSMQWATLDKQASHPATFVLP